MDNRTLDKIAQHLRDITNLINEDWDNDLQNFVDFPDELYKMTELLDEQVSGLTAYIGDIQIEYGDARDTLPYID